MKKEYFTLNKGLTNAFSVPFIPFSIDEDKKVYNKVTAIAQQVQNHLENLEYYSFEDEEGLIKLFTSLTKVTPEKINIERETIKVFYQGITPLNFRIEKISNRKLNSFKAVIRTFRETFQIRVKEKLEEEQLQVKHKSLTDFISKNPEYKLKTQGRIIEKDLGRATLVYNVSDLKFKEDGRIFLCGKSVPKIVVDDSIEDLDKLFENKSPNIKLDSELERALNERMSEFSNLPSISTCFPNEFRFSVNGPMKTSIKDGLVTFENKVLSLEIDTKEDKWEIVEKESYQPTLNFIKENEGKIKYLDSLPYSTISFRKTNITKPLENKVKINRKVVSKFTFPDQSLPTSEWIAELDKRIAEEQNKDKVKPLNIWNSHINKLKYPLVALDIFNLLKEDSMSKSAITHKLKGTSAKNYSCFKDPKYIYKGLSSDIINKTLNDLENINLIYSYYSKGLYTEFEKYTIEHSDIDLETSEFTKENSKFQLVNKLTTSKDLTIQDFVYFINNIDLEVYFRHQVQLKEIFSKAPKEIETLLKMKIKTESEETKKTIYKKLLKEVK